MRYFISLGSNIEPRLGYLEKAEVGLQRIGTPTGKSAIYETEALGPLVNGQPQAWHLNAVIEIRSKLQPEEVVKLLQDIEHETGRKQREKWGPREIDVDIVCMIPENDTEPEVIESNTVSVPHPHMHERNFVLTPLADLIPNYVHPTLHKTVQQLLDDIHKNTDTLAIRTYHA